MCLKTRQTEIPEIIVNNYIFMYMIVAIITILKQTVIESYNNCRKFNFYI